MINKFLLVFVVLLGLISGLEYREISHKQAQIAQKESIALAITDSLHYYRDRLGREVVEKVGIQASLKAVEYNYALLKPNQKLLVRDIQLLPRKERKNLVAGTSIVQNVLVHVVDSVLVPSPFAMAWRKHSDSLNYAIHVADSTLTIDTLQMPNRISLIHYRDSDKKLHVRITNSNPIFHTQDVDTIVPEEAQKKGFFRRVLGFLLGV